MDFHRCTDWRYWPMLGHPSTAPSSAHVGLEGRRYNNILEPAFSLMQGLVVMGNGSCANMPWEGDAVEYRQVPRRILIQKA